jgi:cytochrome c
VTKRAVELNVTPEDPDGRPAGTLPALTTTAAAAPAEAPTEEAAAEEPGAEDPVAEVAGEPATADPALVEAGEKVFKKCAACHKVGEGAKNGTGPHLNGVLGRTAGTLEGFRYSKAMAEAGAGGLTWDEAALRAYLENPKAFVKGTKMTFAGLKSDDDRAAIIAYLGTLAP